MFYLIEEVNTFQRLAKSRLDASSDLANTGTIEGPGGGGSRKELSGMGAERTQERKLIATTTTTTTTWSRLRDY